MFPPLGVFSGVSSLAKNGFLCDLAILLWRHCLYAIRKDTFTEKPKTNGENPRNWIKKVVFTTSCKFSLLDFLVDVIGRGYACREWVMSFYFLRTSGFSLWYRMEFTSCTSPHTLNIAWHSLEDTFPMFTMILVWLDVFTKTVENTYTKEKIYIYLQNVLLLYVNTSVSNFLGQSKR